MEARGEATFGQVLEEKGQRAQGGRGQRVEQRGGQVKGR